MWGSKIFSDRLGTPRRGSVTDNKGQDKKEKFIEYLDNDEELLIHLSGINYKHLYKSINRFFDQYQPERSKREDSVLHNIPEWGSDSSLNFEEWQQRCGALNSMET